MALDTIYYGNSVAQWLYAFGIVLGVYIVGKIVYFIFGKVFKKLTSKTQTKLDDIIVDMIEEPIMLAIIIAGIWYSLKTLTLEGGFGTFLGHVVWVLITINVAWLITRLFDSLFEEYIVPLADKTAGDLDDQLLPVVRKGVKIIIWTLALIIALDNAGYDIAALLAGLGIGGLLIAMAAKDTVANIFGGITIYTDKPFKIRERIRVSGFDGTVTEIGIRSTKMKTLAGTQVTIPNSTFSEEAVENVSKEPSRKIVLNLGLTYDTKPEEMKKAQKILKSISEKHKNMINSDYKIAFNNFGDFSLGIIYIYYIKKSADILETQNSINLDILTQFNKNKLNMAFPTQTIEVIKKK